MDKLDEYIESAKHEIARDSQTKNQDEAEKTERKQEVTPEDIAKLDKQAKITSKEMEPYNKGFSKWLTSLKEKFKKFIGR